jgi:isopentenyldiphosphate isomerase
VQEDAEQFDLCDADGNPTGEIKARAEVHRDGDWHRAFHCWLVVPGGQSGPRLLLQRRSSRKSTWPGRWDVSVGGHYLAGEGLDGGLREIEEELGLSLRADQLVTLGRRREEVFHDNGLIEREVQDEYFARLEMSLADLRPDPREVEAVALASARELFELVAGTRRTVRAEGGDVVEDGLVIPGKVTVQPSQLVPRSGDYYRKVVEAAARISAGEAEPTPAAWW